MTPKTPKWSASLQAQTRSALDEPGPGNFNPSTGSMHFKSHNKQHPYARITLQDLLADKLVLRNEQGEVVACFQNADELIAAGWALD